ncbi:MAG: hypothetical protein QMB89_03880 [Flavobacteriales bacterium]
MKINRLIIILLTLCFFIFFTDKYHFQSSLFNHDFKNAQLEVSQLLWGTNWNAFVFEKRLPNDPSAWLGVAWTGWEAWSSSGFWAAKEIHLFVSESGLKMVGWTLLGGEFERLNEINFLQFKGVSELGILFEIQDSDKKGTIDAQLIDFGDQWKIRGVVDLRESSSLSMGAGMNSDLSGRGWFLFVSKRIDNIEVSMNLNGPQFYLSCGIKRLGIIHSSLFHRQGAVGGSTNWRLKW